MNRNTKSQGRGDSLTRSGTANNPSIRITSQKKSSSSHHATNQIISLEPQKLCFGGANSQAQTLIIRNVSHASVRMQVINPVTKRFNIQNKEEVESFTLPPGLTKKVVVEFREESGNSQDFFDILKIRTQGHTYEMELLCIHQKMRIEYEKLVNLNVLKLNRIHKTTLTFSSRVLCRVALKKELWDNFRLSCEQFYLQPDKPQKIDASFNPTQAGAYHHKIGVYVDEQPVEPIEIVYASQKFGFSLRNEAGEALTQMDFGHIFNGSKKTMRIRAVNDTPNSAELRAKVKIRGKQHNSEVIQSPYEIGMESSSTLIDVFPKIAKISAFAECCLTLSCVIPTDENDQSKFSRLAVLDCNTFLSKFETLQEKYRIPEKSLTQSLICEFLEFEGDGNYPKNSLSINLNATYSIPHIKITPNSVNIGEILNNKTTQLTLHMTNCNKMSSVPVSCRKTIGVMAHFSNPNINPQETIDITLEMKPTRLGPFNNLVTFVLADCFHVDIPLCYEAVSHSTPHPKQLETEQSVDFNKAIELSQYNANKETYNQYVKKSSFLRSQKFAKRNYKQSSEKEKIDDKSADRTYRVLDSMSPMVFNKNVSLAEVNRPYDLFVNKKIDRFLPYQESKDSLKHLKTKKIDSLNCVLRRQPKNRKEAQEITRVLSAECLKQIGISEKVVQFGKLFVNTKISKDFVVENASELAISVRLSPEVHNEFNARSLAMLSETDYQMQVIGPNSCAKFSLNLNATTVGKCQQIINYCINGIHHFQISVSAEVELVTLFVSKPQLKLFYLDDTSEMLMKDSFILRNDGNIAASFNIGQFSSKITVEPKEGVLASGESKTILVTETVEYMSLMAGETSLNAVRRPTQGEERLVVKVKNGNESCLKVLMNSASDVKCIVKQKKIAFGCSIMGKPKVKTFTLKNLTRNVSLYEIVSDLDFLSFGSLKGKISPEGSKEVTVTYSSAFIHCVSASFKVLIRGGIVINVPIEAESIAPSVMVLEDSFDFGKLFCGSYCVRPINIRNDSQIPVQLYLDLEAQKEEGSGFLRVSFAKYGKDAGKETPKNSPHLGRLNTKSEQETIVDGMSRDCIVHKLKLLPKSIFSFHLLYMPEVAGNYTFTLPLYLDNFIRNESMTRKVHCEAVSANFIVEPSIVKFKTRIISEKDNLIFHPFLEYLTLKNPTDRVLRWRIEPQSLSDRMDIHCFEIETKQGQLASKQSITLSIAFNPISEGHYQQKVSFYIFNEDNETCMPQADIRLEGQGKYPSLYFNLKEIILPPVPLGVDSIGMFEVINDGFESTVTLKHKIEIVDLQGNVVTVKGNLNADNNRPELVVIYPEGNDMSTNKKRLYVIVKFMSKKSISFTCRLEIYDQARENRTYSIPLSGTAENSILTTFSYLSDRENLFKIKIGDDLKILLQDNDERNAVDRCHSYYDKLGPDCYLFDCSVVQRWIKQFLREDEVSNYPECLSRGPQMLVKFLHRLTNRKEIELLTLPQQSTASRLHFYESLLVILKSVGCHLNHIRPYFLLERDDFFQYLRLEPEWRTICDYYTCRYEILHREAWLVIFYQAINAFWFNTPKKTDKDKEKEKESNLYSNAELQPLRWINKIHSLTLIEAKTEQAKIEQEKNNKTEQIKAVSPLPEHALLSSVHQFNNNSIGIPSEHWRYLSYGKEMKDCIGLIECLNFYSVVKAENVITLPATFSDFKHNTRILYQQIIKFNIVPIVEEEEFPSCGEKEMFLLAHQLFETLPQNVPKTPPIEFSCRLGESVSKCLEIKNPSAGMLQYWIKIEGSKDFYFQEGDCIRIQPKSVYQFKVQFKSRVSTAQGALLTFFNKSESDNLVGSTMVFQLRSDITGRKTVKKLENVTCRLYESVSVKVPVENQFEDGEYGNFGLQIIEDVEEINLSKDSVNSNNFYLQQTAVKIKKGGTGSIQLTFSPTILSKVNCRLIFSDPKVGEFQYEICGIVELPKPLLQGKYPQAIYMGSKEIIDLVVPPYNTYMGRSEVAWSQKVRGHSREHTNTVESEDSECRFKLRLNMPPLQFITFPSEVVMKGKSSDSGKIKLECNFPVVYKDILLDMYLLSEDRRDVRRLKYTLNVSYRPVTQELVMNTPVRVPLSHDIPILNNTNRDWKVKVTITTDSQCFTLKEGELCVSKEYSLRQTQKQTISIVFCPTWLTVESCKVSIHNITTNEILIYQIEGSGQEPLSDGHIVLKEMNSALSFSITNPNPNRTIYRVSSDLSELQFPKQVEMEGLGSQLFSISKESLISLRKIGYIKFTDETGRYFWHSITFESPKMLLSERNICMDSLVGAEVAQVLQFENSFNKSLQFKMELPEGEGKYVMTGVDRFTIAPKQKYLYELAYRALCPFQQNVTIRATSKETGVILYHTALLSRKELTCRYIQIHSEIGKLNTISVPLTNNTAASLVLTCVNSNDILFHIPKEVVVAPYSQAILHLGFKPYNQDRQVCCLRLLSRQGEYAKYQIQGRGVPPLSQSVIHFVAGLGSSHQSTIKFANPNPFQFSEHLQINVLNFHYFKFTDPLFSRQAKYQTSLEKIDNTQIANQPNSQTSNTQSSNSQIANNKAQSSKLKETSNASRSIEFSGVIGIPLQFEPKQHGYYEAEVVIQCMGYNWTYLLIGSCLPRIEPLGEKIVIENKMETVKIIKVAIPNCMHGIPLSRFNRAEIEHTDKSVMKDLRRWVKVTLRENAREALLQNGNQSSNTQRSVTVFLKLRPMKTINDVFILSVFDEKEPSLRVSHYLSIQVKASNTENSITLSIESIKAVGFELKTKDLGVRDSKVTKVWMARGVYAQAREMKTGVVKVIFTPDHLTFKNGSRHVDTLVVETECLQVRSEVIFQYCPA